MKYWQPQWLLRLRIRRIYARRLDGGFYVFRGSRGEILVKGFLRSTWLTVIARPAPVRKSGIVKTVQLYRRNAQLSLEVPQRPFLVSRKDAFRGRRLELV